MDAAPTVAMTCVYCHDRAERGRTVFCASCLAPHHPACFDLHGRCSILGCAERLVVRPGGAQPTPPIPRRTRFMTTTLLGVGLSLGFFGGVFVAMECVTYAPRDARSEALLPPEVQAEVRRVGRANAALGLRFFDTPVASDRIAIVVDVSESMRAIDGPADEDDGAGTTPPRDPGPGPLDPASRLARVAEEVRLLLDGLPPEARVTLVGIGAHPWVLAPELRPGAADAPMALARLRTLELEQATATDVALERAFALPVGAVYLVSDGLPEAVVGGRVTELPSSAVMAAIRDSSVRRGRPVHAVGFRGASYRSRLFLRLLASAAGGEYGEVR